MKPEEKAKELIKQYFRAMPQIQVNEFVEYNNSILRFDDWNRSDHIKISKDLALIAVRTHLYSENDSPFNTVGEWLENSKYWMEVEKEINKFGNGR